MKWPETERDVFFENDDFEILSRTCQKNFPLFETKTIQIQIGDHSHLNGTVYHYFKNKHINMY